MRKLFKIAITLLLLCTTAACSSGATASITTNSGKKVELTMKELEKQYDENPITFADEYEGAKMTVVGKITDMKGNVKLNGHYMDGYIIIEGGFLVEASDEDDMRGISKGDTVKASGHIYGATVGDIVLYCINGHTTTITKQN